MNEQRADLIENLNEINKRIKYAAERSGRKSEDIKLIAVTKTVVPERIKDIVNEGINNLGENRVQELCEKYDIIDGECNWHLIGHLQTNKVKYIADKISMIHSVDSLELAKEIQIRAQRIGRVIEFLIQVNVSGEESKYGIHPGKVVDFIQNIKGYNNIKLKGLMTIAPFDENLENIRYVFSGLRKIFIDIKKENIDNIDMEYLSMGMSNDFEIAIEEGSNMVRIGSALFGKRQYIFGV